MQIRESDSALEMAGFPRTHSFEVLPTQMLWVLAAGAWGGVGGGLCARTGACWLGVRGLVFGRR